LQVTARFAPDPPHPGTNTLTLTICDRTGQPVERVEVRGTATMGAMGWMAEMKAAGLVEEQGDGVYRLEFDLAMNGSWPLALHLHAPDGREAELEFAYATGIPVRVTSTAGTRGDVAADVAHYTCSMHPSVRASAPGTCPICAMDLVPVMEEEVTSGVIRVDAARRQLIGVKTGRVERKPVTMTIRAVGTVTYDETRLTDVSLKYRGWIGEVYADYTGIAVEAGQPLFTIYAPELLSAQQEYLESVRRGRGGTTSPLLDVAKRRLRLWDLTEAQIGSLTASGQARKYVPILSQVVVVEEAPGRPGVARDLSRYRPAIERLRAAAGEGPQRLGEAGAAEEAAERGRSVARQVGLARLRIAPQHPLAGAPHGMDDLGDREAVLRVADRRREEGGEGQAAGAPPALPPRRDRPRHRHGFPRVAGDVDAGAEVRAGQPAR
jgi:hypothetical protein